MTLTVGCKCRREAVPAGTSDAAVTGPTLKIFARLYGAAFSAIESAMPSLRMKIMSNGKTVFFIQKSTIWGLAKTNSIPASGASERRNIKPASCSFGVLGSSTVKIFRRPFELTIVSDSEGSLGWPYLGHNMMTQTATRKKHARATIR